jgi:hypothetical protein
MRVEAALATRETKSSYSSHSKFMALAAVLGMYAAFLFIGVRAARKVKEGTIADLLVAVATCPCGWLS